MAHFAEIDTETDKLGGHPVLRVLVVDNSDIIDENGDESEEIGKQHLADLFGGTWVQCSYNHNFRHAFPSTHWVWREDLDMFIDQKPFESWTLNDHGDWQPPVPYVMAHDWDEETQQWVKPELIPDDWVLDDAGENWIPTKPYPSLHGPIASPNSDDVLTANWEWDETNNKWIEETS